MALLYTDSISTECLSKYQNKLDLVALVVEELFLWNEAFDVWANQNVAACILCSSPVIMVLSGAAVSIKDHSDLETLAPHGLHKLEVALSNALLGEISLPLDVV